VKTNQGGLGYVSLCLSVVWICSMNYTNNRMELVANTSHLESGNGIDKEKREE
jgi:hypothetical protein